MTTVSTRIRSALLLVLTIYIALVFIESLFFKFADSPETQHIFGTLDACSAALILRLRRGALVGQWAPDASSVGAAA